jgi:ABC-type multidrug transport system ATPase subunit/pimeloyl-ACP methyl ester carboxylesterase
MTGQINKPKDTRTDRRKKGEKRLEKKLLLITTAFAIALVLLLTSCGQSAAPTEATPRSTETVSPAVIAAPTEVSTAKLSAFEETLCFFEVPAGAVEGENVQCGFVIVPEDHSNPDGPTIRIAVVIIKDQSEEHQPDPVMLLSGGPGEKTVHNAPAMAQLLAPIHPNRDLIVFDQRGVGLSEPALECPEFMQALLDLMDEPDPDVALQTQFDALMACRDRLVSEGHNLSAYNTTQNAADVNAIRIALGYDQVNLYGGSYGSLLAQATMRDYPRGIRSVVLTSVLPLEKSLFVEGSTTIAKAIMRLLDTCATDRVCNSTYPDLEGVLFEVIDRLNADPVPITVTSSFDGQNYDALLTGDAVLGNLVGILYQTPLIPSLPQAIYDVNNGDYELITQLISIRLALFDATSRGMLYSVLCTEDLIGRTSEDLLNVRATLPRQMAGTADPEAIVEYGGFGICGNWPVQEAGAWVKEPLVRDIPTLILGGEFDPVTPPEYGELVAEHLSHSYFFEFPGVGHFIIADECARSIAGIFFDDPTRAPDASCVAEMPGVVFDVPVKAAEVVLEPYTNKELGVSGAVPAGWTQVQPGLFARASSALDVAVLQVAVGSKSAKEVIADIAKGYGLETPESTGERQANDLTWSLYALVVQGVPRDLALAESKAGTLIVLLRSAPDERDALYDAVFLPVVEAMTPLAAETRGSALSGWLTPIVAVALVSAVFVLVMIWRSKRGPKSHQNDQNGGRKATTAIEVQNLTRSYDGLRAVDGISFSVEPGEIFGFLGPNGAGKTTTIKMLTGQLRPTSGEAQVMGCDVVEEREQLKPQIGVVFDSQNIYERLSARDNLRFYARLYRIERARVEQVLAQVGLTDRARDKVETYSNGMKQRLVIARALLHKPRVLFLDEPTRGLDPNVARGIRAVVVDLAKQGMTVFLTTHYMEEADQLCDWVAIIDQGRVVALDTPENLKAEYGKDEKTTLEDVFVQLTGKYLGRGSESS